MKLAQRLKELRKVKGVNQSEVAKNLGISVSCYAGYEQGYREPDLKMLTKLSQYFDASTDYLLGVED